jgi:hypothetical protein
MMVQKSQSMKSKIQSCGTLRVDVAKRPNRVTHCVDRSFVFFYEASTQQQSVNEGKDKLGLKAG